MIGGKKTDLERWADEVCEDMYRRATNMLLAPPVPLTVEFVGETVDCLAFRGICSGGARMVTRKVNDDGGARKQ